MQVGMIGLGRMGANMVRRMRGLCRKLGGVLRPRTRGQQGPNGTASVKTVSEPIESLRLGKAVGPESDLSTLDPSIFRKNSVPSTKISEIAVIGLAMRITGEVHSLEPLHVNGELGGTLELQNHRLTIGPNGRIRATVRAKEVEIFGVLEGDVTADKIVLRKHATLIGDLCANTLIIEEGARFEGRAGKANVRSFTSENLRAASLSSKPLDG